jgi:hypothetical protein
MSRRDKLLAAVYIVIFASAFIVAVYFSITSHGTK